MGSNEGGIGWICTLMDCDTGHIVLGFLNGNDIGAIGNLHPLLVVDCWEHAFVKDFGASGRREYITKYTTEIDWKMVWYSFLPALENSLLFNLFSCLYDVILDGEEIEWWTQNYEQEVA